MSAMSMASAEPFTVRVSDEELAFLKQRLSSARIVPDEVAPGEFDSNSAWAYGTDRTTLMEYVRYWLNEYDWRKQEVRLNSVSHFKMSVKGLRLHYIHEPSMRADAIPLLLVHGWPGSVVEFLKVIPALRDEGFHVVVPSLPGYGWSEAPKTRGADCVFMAAHLHGLMQQLGYKQYVVQGGDWGSIIGAFIASHYPQHCVAYHTNMPVPASPPRDLYGILRLLFGLLTMPSSERSCIKDTLYYIWYESAYMRVQGSKPQSLGYGLNDSPVGLLAWILEKFQSWSDCGKAGPEAAGLTKDDILTNVMVYWTTQTITSSCRLYYESLGFAPGRKPLMMPRYIAVPTGILHAKDIIKSPMIAAKLNYNLQHVASPPKGGHFFAFEQPEVFVKEVKHFFKTVLNFERCKASCPAPGQGRPVERGRVLMYILALAGFLAALRRWRRRSLALL